MKTRLTLPGLKTLLVPPPASRHAEVASTIGARALFGPPRGIVVRRC